jgi:hypothetical protein
MRGMEETYGMGAGASVKKGKTAKQVRRARKAIDAKKSASPKMSSSKMDASSRAGYRAPGTKAKPMARRSADSYGSPKGAKKKGTNRLVNTIRSVYSANPRNFSLSGIQNKAGDKNKNKK